MPTLKQLTCTVEWSASSLPLKEYQTTYTDGFVETYVAIPPVPTPFSVHLRSHGYIAPGLAMFVYMDGEYQCNRNRPNLQIPDETTPKKHTEIDFRVRQKEEMMSDGTFRGKQWRFEKLAIASDTNSASHRPAPYNAEYVGIIEVVVLRCYPTEAATPPVHKGSTSQPMSSTQSPNPKNDKASSSEVLPLSHDDKLPSVDLMTGGLFDGAGDDPLNGRLTFGGDMAYDDFIPNQGQSQPRGTPNAGSNPMPGNMSTQQQSSGRSGKFQYKGNWDTPEIDRPIYSPHPRAHDTGATGHGRTSEHSSGHHKNSPAVSNTNRVVDNLGWSAPPQSSPAVIINVNNGPPQPTTWGSLLSSPAVDKPQGNWVVANEGTKGENASQEKNVDQSQKSGMRSPLGSTDSKDYIGSNDNPDDWQDTPAMPGAWYGSYDQTHDNRPGPRHRSRTDHENKTSFDHSGDDHGFFWTNPNKQTRKNEHDRKSSLDTGRYRLDTRNQDNSSTWNNNKNDPGPSWDFSGNHSQGNQDKSSTWGNNNNDPPPRWDFSGNHPQGNQKNSGIQQSNTAGWDSSTNQDQANRNWSSNQESNTRQDGTWGSGNGNNQDQHQSWAGRVEDNSSWAQPVGQNQGKLVSTSASKKSTKSKKRSKSSFSVHDKIAQPNSDAVEHPLCVPSNPRGEKPVTASSAPALEVPQAQIPTLPTTNPGPAIPVAPLTKPYWDTWKHPQECSSGSKPEAATVRSPEPLEPLFSIPSDIAQRSNKSHQVHVSQPVEYVHKKLSPKYMDGFDKPYAVFVFNYRSKAILEQMLNITLTEPEEEEKQRLKSLTKDELIEHYLKAKAEATSNSSSGSETSSESSESKSSSGNTIKADGGLDYGIPQASSFDYDAVNQKLTQLQASNNQLSDSTSTNPEYHWDRVPPKVDNPPCPPEAKVSDWLGGSGGASRNGNGNQGGNLNSNGYGDLSWNNNNGNAGTNWNNDNPTGATWNNDNTTGATWNNNNNGNSSTNWNGPTKDKNNTTTTAHSENPNPAPASHHPSPARSNHSNNPKHSSSSNNNEKSTTEWNRFGTAGAWGTLNHNPPIQNNNHHNHNNNPIPHPHPVDQTQKQTPTGSWNNNHGNNVIQPPTYNNNNAQTHPGSSVQNQNPSTLQQQPPPPAQPWTDVSAVGGGGGVMTSGEMEW